MMSRLRFVAPIAFGVAACSPAPQTDYPLPASAAHALLAKAPPPPFVFGTEEPGFSIDSADPSRVRWTVKKDGSEVLIFTATVSPLDNARSRVALDMTVPASSAFGNIRERFEKKPKIAALYRDAMLERIDSTLERREFDMTAVYSALAKATAENIDGIVIGLDRAAETAQARERAGMEQAYEDAGIGFPNR